MNFFDSNLFNRFTVEWHTDDIQVHMSDIRVTFKYIQVAYRWNKSTYDWHTDEMRVHASGIRMTYEWHMGDYWVHTRQKFKMFKKSYCTRSRLRTPASSEDGAICSKSLKLKAVCYGIVTRSSFLNVLDLLLITKTLS